MSTNTTDVDESNILIIQLEDLELPEEPEGGMKLVLGATTGSNEDKGRDSNGGPVQSGKESGGGKGSGEVGEKRKWPDKSEEPSRKRRRNMKRNRNGMLRGEVNNVQRLLAMLTGPCESDVDFAKKVYTLEELEGMKYKVLQYKE